MDSSTPPLDTRIEIVTPENIAFQYRVAGPFRRLPAYLIDYLVRTVILVVIWVGVFFVSGMIGLWGLGIGVALIAYFLLDWFYGGLFEAFWNGQTPGKRLARIRVLTTDGQPINGFQAVLRNSLRAVDLMPMVMLPLLDTEIRIPLVLYQLGLFAASMNDRFQRLGDLAAGTMVVVEEQQRHFGLARIRNPEAVRLAAELPARLVVTRSLARALSGYIQRRDALPPRRRLEIARHLAQPLCEKWGLPPGTNYDLLLCAFYHRAFVADRAVEESAVGNPFGWAADAAAAWSGTRT